jgi:hypothetical protein
MKDVLRKGREVIRTGHCCPLLDSIKGDSGVFDDEGIIKHSLLLSESSDPSILGNGEEVTNI